MALASLLVKLGALLTLVVVITRTNGSQCSEGFLGKTCGIPPRDCVDLLNAGQTTDGIYTIYPLGSGLAFPVYCDMTTDGGGWLVFQRRKDGTEDFYRNWTDYEKGFGQMDQECWLGNYKMHLISSQRNYELRIDMEDFDFIKAFAKYDTFAVAGPMDNYRLTLSGYDMTGKNGTLMPDIGDSFSPIHNNQTFSTKDNGEKIICANSYKGGWWYNHCHAVHLNGVYMMGGEHQSYANGLVWSSWRGNNYSLKFTEMKMRSVK